MTFERWLQKEGMDPAKLAELTGFHRSYTWKIMTQRRPPSLPFIRRCVEVSGGKLTPNSFFAKARAGA